jgi:glycosyltransferase involved in cell wall biosynthesis
MPTAPSSEPGTRPPEPGTRNQLALALTLALIVQSAVPRVSIIMPVYNGALFLDRSIGSMLAQTFDDFDLIAVDDGSTDRTWEALQTFRDKRIRVFRQKINQGAAETRNCAIQRADCEYLAFLDADDYSEPIRLERQIACLRSNPRAGAVASNAFIEVLGQRTGPGIEAKLLKRQRSPVSKLSSEEISATLLFRNLIVHSTVLLRRSRFQPFRSKFEPAEDYDLWARLVPENNFIQLDDPLITYRSHDGGVSYRFPERMQNAVRAIHQWQLERLGVKPNEELHSRLSAWPPDGTADGLTAAEAWLRELQSASGIYDATAFRRTIERIWFSICLDSWSLGPQAFRIYCRSRFRHLTVSRLWQFVRRYGRRAISGIGH